MCVDSETHLAVIKSTFDGDVVDISIGDRGHLRFLNGRDTTFWVEDEDRYIGFVSESVDGSTNGSTCHSRKRESA